MEKIIYGFYQSSLGEMVLGQTDKGLCWLGFMVEGRKGNGFDRMVGHSPEAEFSRDDAAARLLGDQVMAAWAAGKEKEITCDLRGTVFQKAVWQALLRVKKRQVLSYGALAALIGKPNSARAVGSAVGANPVSLIVPCHRIIQKSGALGHYGWGADLKRRILEEEGFECL